MARANGGEAMIGEGSAGTAQDHEAIEQLLAIAEEHGVPIALEWLWSEDATAQERRQVQALLAPPVYADALEDLLRWSSRDGARLRVSDVAVIATYRFVEPLS